jgi:hypothetical protein
MDALLERGSDEGLGGSKATSMQHPESGKYAWPLSPWKLQVIP